MSDEYFYGVTLSSSHQSETWDPEAKGDYPRSNKLLIRQALLGPDAKADELNVIQVETMCLQESIKIPVAILKVGETRQVRLHIEFPDAPVTFTLIQGSGPVHLIGQHLLGALVEEFEDMEEMEEEMLDEEEGDDSQFKKLLSELPKVCRSQKFRDMYSIVSKNFKKRKGTEEIHKKIAKILASQNYKQKNQQEDENKRKPTPGKRKTNEDEDDEEGEPKGKKSKMSNNAKGKAASPKKNAKK